jgi:hypothetical protein
MLLSYEGGTYYFPMGMWGLQSFIQIRNKFGHSLETIIWKFSEVLDGIYRIYNDLIKPKDAHFTDIHPGLRESRFWPHIKDYIGAIDGRHFPAFVPVSKQPKYIGCHGYA